MKKKLNILICPLEWGLGHAARMIPVAKKLCEMNNNVFIGSGTEHLALYRKEMPDLPLIYFPGFSPRYSQYIPQYISLFFKIPLLLYHIINEHHQLKRIISKYSIDIVISDNRFGLWSRQAKTAYVTHMPLIPLPGPLLFLEFIGIRLHRAIIKKYDLCFIPDLPGEINFSGRLSHGLILPLNTRYIGILSRFTGTGSDSDTNPGDFRHNTVILSGPEPQRSILKKILTDILSRREPPTIFLCGKPDESGAANASSCNIIYHDHLPASSMKEMIIKSEIIISRAGYTTIMELVSLNRSALLIPTPGQTEQEYLVSHLGSVKWFASLPQKKLNKEMLLTQGKPDWPSDISIQSQILLDKALAELTENRQDHGRNDKSGNKT